MNDLSEAVLRAPAEGRAATRGDDALDLVMRCGKNTAEPIKVYKLRFQTLKFER